jgi:hypothetical protein
VSRGGWTLERSTALDAVRFILLLDGLPSIGMSLNHVPDRTRIVSVKPCNGIERPISRASRHLRVALQLVGAIRQMKASLVAFRKTLHA